MDTFSRRIVGWSASFCRDRTNSSWTPWTLATAEWVDWYNHRRLHSEMGHVPPVEYEANFYRATTNSQITANI
ncbi:hypothetical protein GCM10022233_42820 [Streptomyces shaanxiensis]|uniref:Integrase catalytic domain-containing protein n=1 Tax=Streptomyces shaanxiensis TaxID=653357 RepID=A0ABP7VC82_9ACTN